VFAPGADGRMKFRRAIGSEGDAPGRFMCPLGVAVWRGLLVVSDAYGRVQVLTLEGRPLQVLRSSLRSRHGPLDTTRRLGSMLGGLCASGDRVWVAGLAAGKVYVLERGEDLNTEGRAGARRELCTVHGEKYGND